MSTYLPTPIFQIELIKMKGDKIVTTIQASGQLVRSFDMVINPGLSSCVTTITLVDPTWEVAQDINVHQMVQSKDEYVLCRYLFGHTHSIWTNLEGSSEPATTNELIGTVSNFKPTFSEEGIEITLTILGVSLQKVLQYVNQTFSIDASINNLKDAYQHIANFFNIDIRTVGSSVGTLELDPTPFRGKDGSKEQLTLPTKKSGQTGLDYLAEIYEKYPPTIGGKATYARFNPFAKGNNGEGVFEILPDTGTSRIKRVYRYSGTDSRVLSFSPNLTPFKLDKGTEAVQLSSVDNEGKERNIVASENLNTNDIAKIQVGQKDPRVLENQIKHIENSLLENIFTAELRVIGDINIFRGDVVQVELYNKLNGSLIMSHAYFVLKVNHSLEDGQIVTTLSLTKSEYNALLSEIKKTIVPDLLTLEDELKDKALSEWQKLKDTLNTLTGGIFNL